LTQKPNANVQDFQICAHWSTCTCTFNSAGFVENWAFIIKLSDPQL